MIDYSFNWWAIIVSVVAIHFLGFLWYGPFFGKMWMRLSGINPDTIDKKKGMNAMLIGLVASVVMIYTLAHMIYTYGATTISAGLQGGFWVWLGFIAVVLLNSVLYEKKPLKVYFINIGYYFVALPIAGAIIAVWR